MDEGRLMDVIDPFIKEGASKVEIETLKAMGGLAAACLDERRQNRPSMKEVADEIEYIIGIVTGGADSTTGDLKI
nr:wall-associated receptor kinase-like 20 [Ipomoea trifida]